MGVYFGDYQSIWRVWKATTFSTIWGDLTDSSRTIAKSSQDVFLPDIWRNWVNSGSGCRVTEQTLRRARLWTTQVTYLELVVPWLEGTEEYNSFFETIQNDNRIQFFTLLGESITNEVLKWRVNQP